MSAKHPIIAITGSSGAGTTTTTNAIRHIFRNLSVNAAVVSGDSFHRYTRPEMELEIRKAQAECKQGQLNINSNTGDVQNNLKRKDLFSFKLDIFYCKT